MEPLLAEATALSDRHPAIATAGREMWLKSGGPFAALAVQ